MTSVAWHDIMLRPPGHCPQDFIMLQLLFALLKVSKGATFFISAPGRLWHQESNFYLSLQVPTTAPPVHKTSTNLCSVGIHKNSFYRKRLLDNYSTERTAYNSEVARTFAATDAYNLFPFAIHSSYSPP